MTALLPRREGFDRAGLGALTTANPGIRMDANLNWIWFDQGTVRTGHEVSFTPHFYKPQPLRSLEEIRADILALERETDGLLA